MKTKKRRLILIIPLAALFFVTPVSAAERVYSGYNYDSWGVSIPAPVSYEPEEVYTGEALGTSALNNPKDMIFSGDKLYILDGNGRILICDSRLKLERELILYSKDGQKIPLEHAEGLYVRDSRIAVADNTPEAPRVLIAGFDGIVIKEISSPPAGTLPKEAIYSPKKVLLDDSENVYVLSSGCYLGALIFNGNGNFESFFGANKVSLSAAQLLRRFWRTFMTRTQKGYVEKYVPVEYKGFDIDKDGFIYTCSNNINLNETSVDELKKLNALGNNVLNISQASKRTQRNNYGDKEQIMLEGSYYDTHFIDISVCSDGFINALDETRGRVFQYDQSSNLLAVFGGEGEQKGCFVNPVAVESIGGNVLVLDAKKNTLTVFRPTLYGAAIRRAVVSQREGLLDEAVEAWNEALRYNTVSELANSGIGRALLQRDEYKAAMKYLKLGQDRDGYSKAYRFYRAESAGKFFPFLAAGIILMIFWLLARKRIKEIIYKRRGTVPREKTVYISHLVSHPLVFFEDMFYRTSKKRDLTYKKKTAVLSAVICALFVLALALQRQATGFIFNYNKTDDFSFIFVLGISLGLPVLITVSGWLVGSLMWGEGTVSQIWTGTCFALLPYIVSMLASVALSNFLTLEEGALSGMVLTTGLLYTIFLLFTSIRVTSQYSIRKALAACFFIIAVSLLILFLIILIYTLLRQFSVFLLTVFNEIMFRL